MAWPECSKGSPPFGWDGPPSLGDQAQMLQGLQVTQGPGKEGRYNTLLLPQRRISQKSLSLHPDVRIHSGPILVHCSADVGRTGTFLTLYKLWMDFQSPSCHQLAILPTVLALRQQRMKMVQKSVRYSYLASCIRFPRLRNVILKKCGDRNCELKTTPQLYGLCR